MRAAGLIALMALAGCTAASADTQRGREARAQRELGKALAGRVAGPPQDCISAIGNNGPRVIDDHTLLYDQGRRVWRNDLPESCPGLDDDDLLVIEVYGSQICRNDRFRANSRGSVVPGPSCRLGSFTPYVKAR